MVFANDNTPNSTAQMVLLTLLSYEPLSCLLCMCPAALPASRPYRNRRILMNMHMISISHSRARAAIVPDLLQTNLTFGLEVLDLLLVQILLSLEPEIQNESLKDVHALQQLLTHTAFRDTCIISLCLHFH